MLFATLCLEILKTLKSAWMFPSSVSSPFPNVVPIVDRDSGINMSLPLQADAAISHESHLEAYAFLHCEQLRTERIKIDLGALKQWGKANAKHILAVEPSTKKYGFFIVTAIHRVRECQLKCWMRHAKIISPSLSVSPSTVPLTGSLEASRLVDASQSGWIIRPSEDDLLQVCAPYSSFADYLFADPEYIVFIEGFHFASYAYGLVTKITEDVSWIF